MLLLQSFQGGKQTAKRADLPSLVENKSNTFIGVENSSVWFHPPHFVKGSFKALPLLLNFLSREEKNVSMNLTRTSVVPISHWGHKATSAHSSAASTCLTLSDVICVVTVTTAPQLRHYLQPSMSHSTGNQRHDIRHI